MVNDVVSGLWSHSLSSLTATQVQEQLYDVKHLGWRTLSSFSSLLV